MFFMDYVPGHANVSATLGVGTCHMCRLVLARFKLRIGSVRLGHAGLQIPDCP